MLQTDLFLKSNAASASTNANTASTNGSDTVKPAHQGDRQDSKEYEQEEEQNKQEEDEEADMDMESIELTNTKQQSCQGSECGLAEATEMETNAAGGSLATGTGSVATPEDQINYFSPPNSTTLNLFFKFHSNQLADDATIMMMPQRWRKRKIQKKSLVSRTCAACKNCALCCYFVLQQLNLFIHAYNNIWLAYKSLLTLSCTQMACKFFHHEIHQELPKGPIITG